MNLLKKISGSFLLGLAVIGLAIGTSAFTPKASGHLVNTGSQNFENRTNHSPMNCQETEPTTCAYEILSPADVPDQSSYTPSEIQTYLNNGWIEELPAKGVYTD